MIFNSLAFVVFLPVVLGLYVALQRKLAVQNFMLLLASYVFYGWWDWRFLSLIVFSTLVDYFCALQMENTHGARKKLFLIISMVVNLGVLAFFKYAGFFVESATELLALIGFAADVPTLRIILPVGISFYTFQSMSYTIDVYRKELKPTTRLLDFALYVAFFPQLVAGPIERAKRFLPQIQTRRILDGGQISDGIWLILMGYVKKVVIADRLGQIANMGFMTESPSFGTVEACVFVIAFAFQIYGDFSGYSNIARGVAKLMGFELMVNFRKPYLVTNPSQFWRNWHISLSTWLRDYLYIPLGGNKIGRTKTYRNLMLTMLLGGLWHGAGWAFVIWGFYHGILLAVHRVWSRSRFSRPVARSGVAKPEWISRLKSAGFILLFFVLTCIGWLFFRAGTVAPGINQAMLVLNYLGALLSGGGVAESLSWMPSLLLLGGLALWFQYRNDQMENFQQWGPVRQAVSTSAALALIAVFGVFDGAQFIYFQF